MIFCNQLKIVKSRLQINNELSFRSKECVFIFFNAVSVDCLATASLVVIALDIGFKKCFLFRNKDAKDAVKEGKETKEAPEPSTFNVKNPARVVRLQLKTLQVLDESRYKPLKNLNHGGIIILKDNKPGEKEDIVALVPAGGSTNAPGSANPDFPVPAAFEITLTNY
uniref:26S proteasome regulatory subunit RPN2 C-terminal domain-containing protein n=1 Tax=Panagrolaimus superbus TaxID=310955 RepID=A0A914YSB1_9BILA